MGFPLSRRKAIIGDKDPLAEAGLRGECRMAEVLKAEDGTGAAESAEIEAVARAASAYGEHVAE